MKNLLIVALFLFTGFITANAQSTNVPDSEKMLVGTWEVQPGTQGLRLQSLVFFADGTINLNYEGTKRVQRYKILEEEKGYTLQLVEIINGKPLESIKIIKLSKAEMEIGYEGETEKFTVRFKKAST